MNTKICMPKSRKSQFFYGARRTTVAMSESHYIVSSQNRKKKDTPVLVFSKKEIK